MNPYHIGAVSVSAYMRCDVWHLNSVNIIISTDHMIESVLPVHCHKWHSRMKEYVHHFIVFAYYPNFNCNPANKSPIVQLRCSSDSGSAYLQSHTLDSAPASLSVLRYLLHRPVRHEICLPALSLHFQVHPQAVASV